LDEKLYPHIQKVENQHWWYVARRKIIFDWVLRFLAEYPSPRILDVGCGTGYNLEYLIERGYHNVVGLDFSTSALEFCQSRGLKEVVCADGTFPPFQSNSFDMITSLDMIEHVKDDAESLKALARMLKPNGTLIIFTPAFQFLWGWQDEISHHYRRYTAPDLRAKIEAAGLKIEKLTYANTLLFPMIWAGRNVLKITGHEGATSENDLHPSWSNGILKSIFSAELPLLRHINMPFGVSLLCVARKG
jgi:2-polyprenyl-3-methyl-5-hydroxy-6-metoxy-1,4-benzoquinol methylase